MAGENWMRVRLAVHWGAVTPQLVLTSDAVHDVMIQVCVLVSHKNLSTHEVAARPS